MDVRCCGVPTEVGSLVRPLRSVRVDEGDVDRDGGLRDDSSGCSVYLGGVDAEAPGCSIIRVERLPTGVLEFSALYCSYRRHLSSPSAQGVVNDRLLPFELLLTAQASVESSVGVLPRHCFSSRRRLVLVICRLASFCDW